MYIHLCTSMHLTIISTYKDKVPQNRLSYKNPEKKRAREPLFEPGAWMTEGSREAVQVTWPPLVTARRPSGLRPVVSLPGPRVATPSRFSGRAA